MSKFFQVFWLVWGFFGILIAGYGFSTQGIQWEFVFCMVVSVVLFTMMAVQLTYRD